MSNNAVRASAYKQISLPFIQLLCLFGKSFSQRNLDLADVFPQSLFFFSLQALK